MPGAPFRNAAFRQGTWLAPDPDQIAHLFQVSRGNGLLKVKAALIQAAREERLDVWGLEGQSIRWENATGGHQLDFSIHRFTFRATPGYNQLQLYQVLYSSCARTDSDFVGDGAGGYVTHGTSRLFLDRAQAELEYSRMAAHRFPRHAIARQPNTASAPPSPTRA
jgi:hypothetical protein